MTAAFAPIFLLAFFQLMLDDRYSQDQGEPVLFSGSRYDSRHITFANQVNVSYEDNMIDKIQGPYSAAERSVIFGMRKKLTSPNSQIKTAKEFIQVANEQFRRQELKDRSDVNAAFIQALSCYYAWSCACHCRNREELQQAKDSAIGDLLDMVRAAAEWNFSHYARHFDESFDPSDEWLSRISIEKIERTLELAIPNDLKVIYTACNRVRPQTIEFSIPHLDSSWGKCHYRLLLDDFNSGAPGKIAGLPGRYEAIVQTSLSLRRQLREKVLCFAYCLDAKDQLVALYFGEDGKIYLYTDDVERGAKPKCIAERLDQLFIFDASKLHADAHRLPPAFDRITLEEALDEGSWVMWDVETVDDPAWYEDAIKALFINTSQGLLALERFRFSKSRDECSSFELRVNQRTFTFMLHTDSDMIDPAVIDEFNRILETLGIRGRRFWWVYDSDWGQEFCVAFADESRIDRLKENGYAVS